MLARKNMDTWDLSDLEDAPAKLKNNPSARVGSMISQGNVISVPPELEPLVIAIKLYRDFDAFSDAIKELLTKSKPNYQVCLDALDNEIKHSSLSSVKGKELAIKNMVLYRYKIINNMRRLFGFSDSEIISGDLRQEYKCDERIQLWMKIVCCIPDKHITEFDVNLITNRLIESLPKPILSLYGRI